MKRKTYAEKLKDPRWQKVRLKIMERDGFECKSCGNGNETLNVHHLCYFPNEDPWEYGDIFMLTLCDSCHKTFHENNGYSQYFVMREINMMKSTIAFSEDQKSYDIGGILRFFGADHVTIKSEKFKFCEVLRSFDKTTGEITFKLVEREDNQE